MWLNAKRKILVTALAVAGCLSFPQQEAKAQWIVMDIGAELNTMMTWFETVLQYVHMIEEYEENVRDLADFVGSPFEELQDNLIELIDLVDTHFNEFGGMDNYLNYFKEVKAYADTPCFTKEQQCTQARLEELLQTKSAGILGMKRANDRLFRQIKQQQDNLRADAARLNQMRQSASSTKGRNEAMQASAQLTGEVANQLLQIRNLMIAQQQMQATKSQLDQDKDAQDTAAVSVIKRGTYVPGGRTPW